MISCLERCCLHVRLLPSPRNNPTNSLIDKSCSSVVMMMATVQGRLPIPSPPGLEIPDLDITLSLLSLHSRLGTLLQDPKEDLEQGQQHLRLRGPCCRPVSSCLSFLKGFLHLISTSGLLALPLGFDSLFLACSASMSASDMPTC